MLPFSGARVLARVRRRLIPFAFICYVVAYIDRVNIGFAAHELQRPRQNGHTTSAAPIDRTQAFVIGLMISDYSRPV